MQSCLRQMCNACIGAVCKSEAGDAGPTSAVSSGEMSTNELKLIVADGEGVGADGHQARSQPLSCSTQKMDENPYFIYDAPAAPPGLYIGQLPRLMHEVLRPELDAWNRELTYVEQMLYKVERRAKWLRGFDASEQQQWDLLCCHESIEYLRWWRHSCKEELGRVLYRDEMMWIEAIWAHPSSASPDL